MKISAFKTFFLLLTAFYIISCSSSNSKQVSEQPNIIYIMSDDHGYQAISAYGYEINKTPNIDRLANEGAMFTRSCVTNSLCAPSRAVLLTGKHSFINGKVDNVQPFNWDQENFPKILQANGYQTAMVGKIHLDGTPQGFDFSMVLQGQGHYYNPDFIVNGIKKQIHGYCTDIITKTALDWLKNKRNPDKPFCLLYHQKAPHRGWLPEEKYYKEYTKMKFKEPETLFDDYKNRGSAAASAEMNILSYMNLTGDLKIYPHVLEKLGIKESTNQGVNAFNSSIGRMDGNQLAAWDSVYGPLNEKFIEDYPDMTQEDIMRWKYQRYMQDYLACVASVDEGVGELLDYLDESGLAKNTVVIYTSDQGFFMGEHGWFDKRFMYRESFGTPLLMRYPKEIKPGTKIDDLVQNLDFAPTILDYAGIKRPVDMQGESFRNLVSGKTADWRDAAYYTYYEYPSYHMVKRHYGVATKRYKLIHYYYDVDEWELYDLENDPQEINNIYNDTNYDNVREMMHQKLDSIREYYGDSDELDQKFLKSYLSHHQ